MATAETARLIASLELKDQFTGTASKISRSVDGLDKSITGAGSRSYKAGQQIGTGIKNGALLAAGAIGFLATQIGFGLRELSELETITSQTNAVLKSTKGVAGETAGSIRQLAEKYEALNATIDDKVIQSAENVLLTFTAIRKDAFEPAIAAALDMSTALGTDLQGSVIQIGKALQDPIKGITALRRVGVNFSTDQIKVIKKLVETGDVLGAQKVILKELNTEFGGSFLAGGNTTAGKVAKFQDSIEDLQKALATALLPTIGKVADGLSKFLADPKVVGGISDLGKSIASLFSDKNLATGGEFLRNAFETAKAAAPVLVDAGRALFTVVKGAVDLFRSLPPEIQKLAIGAFAVNKLTGGLVTNIGGALAGGLASFLAKSFTGGMNVNAAVVNVNGAAIPGVPGVTPVGGGGGVLGALKQGAKFVLPIAVGVLIANAIREAAGITPEQAAAQNSKGQFGPRSAGSATSGPGTTIGGAINKALVNLGLGPAITKAGDNAALDARRIEAAENRAGLDVVRALGTVRGQLRVDLRALLHATKANDVAKFAKRIAGEIARGSGSLSTTKETLKDLKIKLAETHDPKLQAVLRSAIAKVEGKLPNREFVNQQLTQAKKIASGTESEKRKLDQLNAIQRTLRQHGDTHAAKEIERLKNIAAKVEDAKKKISADTRSEGAGIRRAVNEKDLSVTNNISIPISISNRDTVTRQRYAFKFGHSVS